MKFSILAGLLCCTGLASPVAAATLEIVVANLRPGKGEILVTVCPKELFLKESCPYRGRAPARAAEVAVIVRDIPPGIYAVQAFQDEDGSGRIPRSFLGVPKVGIGFSNDAPFRFGPPSFADAAVQLTAAGGRIRLSLRYFD